MIKKQEKGFTLIELIMVIMLIAIVGAIMSQLISFSSNAFNRSIDLTEGATEGDFVLQFISNEIRRNDTSNSIALRGDYNEILEIKSEDGFYVSDVYYTYQWIYQEGKEIYHRFSDSTYTTAFASPGIEGIDVFKITYGEKIDSLEFEEQRGVSIKVTVRYYTNKEDVANKVMLIPIKSDYEGD